MKTFLSKKGSPIKSILSRDDPTDDRTSDRLSQCQVSSDEETSSNSAKTGFTGPIHVSEFRKKAQSAVHKPQGIPRKRFTSRGRGKRPSSPSSSCFALSTMDSTYKSEIDENDNMSTFQANHWPDHASHALKAEPACDEGFTRDSSPPKTVAIPSFGDNSRTSSGFGSSSGLVAQPKYAGFGSSNRAPIPLQKPKPDYPPNGKCSTQELMCDQLNFKEIYEENSHIGFTFLKSVGKNQYPDIHCPMGCALRQVSKLMFHGQPLVG